VPATGLAHDAYNIAFGRFTPVRELLDAFGPELAVETVGDPAEADVDMDPADRLARWNAYDIGRVRADTGWEPRPLAEQVREYVDWVRADPGRRCPALP
jgi:nucleoside-diphosphate-sugar epimerase